MCTVPIHHVLKFEMIIDKNDIDVSKSTSYINRRLSSTIINIYHMNDDIVRRNVP